MNKLIVHYLAEKPKNDIEELTWDGGTKNQAIERIQTALAGIKSGGFDPSPGPHCRFCDFQDLCPTSKSNAPIACKENDEPGIGATFRTLRR